jgi:hypothetical protein
LGHTVTEWQDPAAEHLFVLEDNIPKNYFYAFLSATYQLGMLTNVGHMGMVPLSGIYRGYQSSCSSGPP